MQINSIIIVGGGSSGWFTASMLAKKCPEIDVTLIESPNVPTIGVGESTVLNINWFINALGMEDEDWMPQCDATYKATIKFTDFHKKGEFFHYPFGPEDHEGTKFEYEYKGEKEVYDLKANTWFLKKWMYPDTPQTDFAESFWPVMQMVNKNKIHSNEDHVIPQFNLKIHWAYQLDATKLGIWLRDYYCKARYGKNFTHILAEVKDIPLNENGIKHLVLDSGRKLKADLFIDCTGFRSLLLGQALKVSFNSLEKLIPNNSAWATKIPYTNPEKQIVNYTNCTAIANGWVWEIPLWSRMGAGYVFSDKFISSKDALKEFKSTLLKKGYRNVENLEYKLIPMKCGCRSQLWVKNTCAIGLSAGFIEPLHSNGLHTTHEFIFNLIRVLAQGRINQWDRQCFTAKCHYDFNRFSALVALTYTLSHRDDTEYWRDIQNRDAPDVLEPNIGWGYGTVFNQKMIQGEYDVQGIFPCIAAGMNWNPTDIHTLRYHNAFDDFNQTYDFYINQLNSRKKKWNKEVKDFMSPYQYLKKYIHKSQ